MDPLVSIILPTYNRAALIGRSIRSLLCQSEARFEVLIVDDGSTDNTERVVAGFGDPRLRYLRLERNKGAPAARNVGIRSAAAPRIAFQDSDDEWAPEKLRTQLQELDAAGPCVGAVYSDMVRIASTGTETYHRSPTILPNRFLNPATGFYQTYYLGIQTTLVRRELLVACGGLDERLGFYDDLELYLRIAQQCEFRHIREPLVRYHETFGLISNWRRELADRKIILRRHRKALAAEDSRFVRREAAFLAVRTALGPFARGWTQSLHPSQMEGALSDPQ